MQKNYFGNFFEDHKGFLENLPIALIDKMGGRDPKKREDHW